MASRPDLKDGRFSTLRGFSDQGDLQANMSRLYALLGRDIPDQVSMGIDVTRCFEGRALTMRPLRNLNTRAVAGPWTSLNPPPCAAL